MTMEPEKMSGKQEEVLSILEDKFPSLPPREDIINVLKKSQFSAQGEWRSPGTAAAPESGRLVVWHVARPQEVNLILPSLFFLLFTFVEDFQVRDVGSPGSRQPVLQPLLQGLRVRMCGSFTRLTVITWNLCTERVLLWEYGRSNVKHNGIL